MDVGRDNAQGRIKGGNLLFQIVLSKKMSLNKIFYSHFCRLAFIWPSNFQVFRLDDALPAWIDGSPEAAEMSCDGTGFASAMLAG